MTQDQVTEIIASEKRVKDLHEKMKQIIISQQELAKKQQGKDNEDYHDGKAIGMIIIKQMFMDEFEIK